MNNKIAEVMNGVSGELSEHKLRAFYEVLSTLDENISFQLKEEKYGN
jgi:hypothetical protein